MIVMEARRVTLDNASMLAVDAAIWAVVQRRTDRADV